MTEITLGNLLLITLQNYLSFATLPILLLYFASIELSQVNYPTPKEIALKEEDTAEALKPVLSQILAGIKDALENTPPELSADLVDMGLVLTGGGALLKNIDKLISKETGLPVQIAEDPLSCVAFGCGKALDEEQTFSTLLLGEG